jgi:biopolymer transport protein ExbB
MKAPMPHLPRATYRRLLGAAILLSVLLGVAAIVHAQEAAPAPAAAAPGGVSTTIFERFFWSPDPLGCAIIWALILTSVVGVALIIIHTMASRRSVMVPEELALSVEQLLQEKKYREAIEITGMDESALGRIMHEALCQASFGYAAMQQAVEDTAALVSAELVRRAEPLNILGAVGPMAGLFGTVYGMIQSFYRIAASGTQPKPAELAGGISTALVCTFWGLVVAVPAVISYGIIRTRIEGLTDVAVGRVAHLIAPFRPQALRRGGAAPSTGSGQAEPEAAPGMAPATTAASNAGNQE